MKKLVALFAWVLCNNAFAQGFPTYPNFYDVGISTSSQYQTKPAGEQGYIRAASGLSVGDPAGTGVTDYSLDALSPKFYIRNANTTGNQRVIMALLRDEVTSLSTRYGAINFDSFDSSALGINYAQIKFNSPVTTAGATQGLLQLNVQDGAGALRSAFTASGLSNSYGQNALSGQSNIFYGSLSQLDDGSGTNTIALASPTTINNLFNVNTASASLTVTTFKNTNVGGGHEIDVLNGGSEGWNIQAPTGTTSTINCANTTCAFQGSTRNFLTYNTSTFATSVGDSSGVTNIIGSSVDINGSPLISTGSFTATIANCSAASTGTVHYRTVGNVAVLWADASSPPLCTTSTGTDLTMSGLPAGLIPVTEHRLLVLSQNLSTDTMSWLEIGGAITTLKFSICSTTSSCTAAGYTATGSKGITSEWTVTYPLD